MKLYCTPGGTWAGTEKDWKDAVKAEGLDPKSIDRKIVEVPTAKKPLMEFLTFHNVNAICPAGGRAPEVSLPGDPPPPSPAADSAATTVPSFDLDAAFEAAPIKQRLRLAVTAIDAADAALS